MTKDKKPKQNARESAFDTLKQLTDDAELFQECAWEYRYTILRYLQTPAPGCTVHCSHADMWKNKYEELRDSISEWNFDMSAAPRDGTELILKMPDGMNIFAFWKELGTHSWQTLDTAYHNDAPVAFMIFTAPTSEKDE